MACRGVLFALSDEDEKKALACSSDDELLSVIQDDIEERWDEEHLEQTDKAWDAMHRCLSDGYLSYNTESPAALCILGGKQLHRGESYIVSFKTRDEVRQIATELQKMTEDAFRERYFSLSSDYEHPLDEEDFGYTWEYFDSVREFYKRAAAANRSVIFTVDQ